jgi:hypothetical protein
VLPTKCGAEFKHHTAKKPTNQITKKGSHDSKSKYKDSSVDSPDSALPRVSSKCTLESKYYHIMATEGHSAGPIGATL